VRCYADDVGQRGNPMVAAISGSDELLGENWDGLFDLREKNIEIVDFSRRGDG